MSDYLTTVGRIFAVMLAISSVPVWANGVPGTKRDLDFVVNTRSCRLEGFSQAYRCGEDVRRSGGERKKAEMVFMVQVNRAP